MFLQTSADIAIYGGSAGGGKTYALLLDPVRYVDVPKFGGVVFRRTAPEISAEGGLWDTAQDIYRPLHAEFIKSPYRVTFPAKTKIEFRQLQYEDSVYQWQSSQIPYIAFDELTHFTKKQFFYMMSRNRSDCGVKPYIRATCNPDPTSWVREFISWWLDDNDEYPDLSKAGKIRWMVRQGDETLWFSAYKEAKKKLKEITKDVPKEYIDKFEPISVTFIPSTVYDNKILLTVNPEYLSNLAALPRVERERLLRSNWKIRYTAGALFNRNDFEIVQTHPRVIKQIRYWDRAATKPHHDNPDPDWTRGVKMCLCSDGAYYVTDVASLRDKPGKVESLIERTAILDTRACFIGLEQEPGASGVSEIDAYMRLLASFPVKEFPARGKKIVRWLPFAAAVEHGFVKLIEGAWNETFLSELESLTDDDSEYDHDDQADAASGAYNAIAGLPIMFRNVIKDGEAKLPTSGLRRGESW